AQAPKPASGGGAEACLAAALVEGFDAAIANGDLERIRDIWSRRLSAIAAEAGTAKDVYSTVDHNGVVMEFDAPPAADRLAQTVTDASGAPMRDAVDAYRVEADPESACAHCHTGPMFDVIGPDGVAQGVTFEDECAAEEYAG